MDSSCHQSWHLEFLELSRYSWQKLFFDVINAFILFSDYLAKREVGIKEHEDKIRAQRDARLKAEGEAKMKGEETRVFVQYKYDISSDRDSQI